MRKLSERALAFLRALKERVAEALNEAWLTEPARVISITVSAVTGVLAAAGISIASGTIEVLVELAIPLVLGELIRSQVAPKAKMAHKVGAREGLGAGKASTVKSPVVKTSHDQEHHP